MRNAQVSGWWTLRTCGLIVIAVMVALCITRAGAQPVAPVREVEIPPPLTQYMGREIAQTMHWLGAEWLIRETREKEENPALVMKNLGLKPGMTVADLGCGNGFYTTRLARAVGEAGRVYAVEIQPEYFPLLEERAREEGLTNIQPVLGTLIDPRLPEASCDLIFLADVYHEFSHPVHMLAAIRKALKPTGRVVLLEFRAEDTLVPIKPLHKMSKTQVEKELTANGFRPAGAFDGLPWQHMLFFERDDAPPAKHETQPPAGASNQPESNPEHQP